VPGHIEIRDTGDVIIDDPEEVARINTLEAEAEAEVQHRKQGPRKRRPKSGRHIHFWADTELQAELEAIDPGAPSVAAKRIVLEFFAKR